MKTVKWILLIIDALALIFFVSVRIWWQKTHKEPGLSEMLNIREVNTGILITGIILVVLIIVMILTRARK